MKKIALIVLTVATSLMFTHKSVASDEMYEHVLVGCDNLTSESIRSASKSMPVQEYLTIEVPGEEDTTIFLFKHEVEMQLVILLLKDKKQNYSTEVYNCNQ